MTQEKVKKLINENRELIGNLTPSKTRNFTYDFLKKCIHLMEKEDPSKIDEGFLEDFRSVILDFTDAIIKCKTSSVEKDIIRAASDLLYNVACNYNITKCKTELNTLTILADSSKSLEDILYVLIFMFNKLSCRLEEEPSSNYLSRKYYAELSDFLTNRKSHDEKYNV